MNSDDYGPASSGTNSLQDDDLRDLAHPIYEPEEHEFQPPPRASTSKKTVKRGGRGGARSKRTNEQIYETKLMPPKEGSSNAFAVKPTAPAEGSLEANDDYEKRAVPHKSGRSKAHEPIIVAMEPRISDDTTEEEGLDKPIMASIDDIAKIHGIPCSKFELIPFEVYRRFDGTLPNFYLSHDTKNDDWSISRTKMEKSMNLKNIGHYAMIINYSHRKDGSAEEVRTPIIFGINQEKLNVASSEETLKVYEFENKMSTMQNHNVKMYVITTKKKYATIMFEKVLQCPKISYISLKKPQMWTPLPRKV